MPIAGFSAIPAAIAGLIVWAAHFGFVYAVSAIACARGLAGRQLWGLPLLPTLVLGATALGLLGVAAIGLLGWRRLRRTSAERPGDAAPQFLPWLTLAVALLAGLAMVWEALPVLLLPACG